MSTVRHSQTISDPEMRRALDRRAAAVAEMGEFRGRPISALPSEIATHLDAISARLRAARATVVAGLWQRHGRWADCKSDRVYILDVDGDGYLTLGPGVDPPSDMIGHRVRRAEAANARRFGFGPGDRTGYSCAREEHNA